MQSPRVLQFVSGAGLTLLLAACSPGAQPADSPYANGAAYPWSYTAPADRIQTQSLTPGVNTLYYEPILAATNGWGPLEIDHSNGEQGAGDGRTLTLNGVPYRKGLGVHAGSEIRYSLKGQGASCTRFTAQVGVDDEVGSRGSVVFQVYVDGRQVADSGVLTGSSATQQLSADVTGGQELRLVVTNAGDNSYYDHADWADPKIICQAVTNTAPRLTLDRTSLEIFHKHSATLQATFGNLSGSVDLRLVPASPQSEIPLKLETTRVDLPAVGGARGVVISAPTLPSTANNPADLSADYLLIASQNGKDVASARVALTESLLRVTASLTPQTVSGAYGDTRRLTLTVSVEPPLDSPVPLALDPIFEGTSRSFDIQPVGPVTGDGGTMRQTFDLTLKADPSRAVSNISTESADYMLRASDFAGYRLPGYGSKQFRVAWTVERQQAQ